MPEFTTTSNVRLSPAETFAFICDTAQWPAFRGYGPLPGIVEAKADAPMRLGSRVRVRNTDGSIHHEVIEIFEPGRRYGVRMELSAPASYVFETIRETVDLLPHDGGTRIVRHFSAPARAWFSVPIAWLFCTVFLRRAVDAHNRAVASGSQNA